MNNQEIQLIYAEQHDKKGVNQAIVGAEFGNFKKDKIFKNPE